MEPAELMKQFQQAPIPKWMNADMSFETDGSATVTLEIRKEHLQATGVAHGSIITFAADTSAWFTAASASKKLVMTSGFNLDLLRAANEGDTLTAKSSVIKSGRTLVVVRTTVTCNDGKLIAEGSFTHAVV